jgi:hypothetical protein
MVHSSSGGRDPQRPRTRAQARLGLPPPDPQPSHPRTGEVHVAHDTASSTHRSMLLQSTKVLCALRFIFHFKSEMIDPNHSI